MDYAEWERRVPAAITADSLWKTKSYRLALLAADLGWTGVSRLVRDLRDRRLTSLADQLYRAVGSIGANIAEGYSRDSGRDRARFYEYALGSARESRDWYYKARHVLGEATMTHRLDTLAGISRLLLTALPDERRRHCARRDVTST